LLACAARSGKAFTVLVALILSLPRKTSLLIIDPKGELTCICAHFLAKRGKLIVLNPFGLWQKELRGLKQGRYNPMMDLDSNSIDFHSACDKQATSFWVEKPNDNDTFWSPSSKQAVSGVIAALRKYGKPEEQNLAVVRDVITGSNGHSFIEFARKCMTLPDPYIRQKLARLAQPDAEDSKEVAGIISTAITMTGFIGNAAIAESLKGSDFSFRELKRKPGMCVCSILPLNRMDVVPQFNSLLTGCMLDGVLEESQRGGRVKVLAIIDEISNLGFMKSLQDAWGMAAGAAGLQLVAVYQDISQIRNQFGNAWQTILQNSGVKIFFRSGDHETCETVSKLAGLTEVFTRNRSVSQDFQTGRPHVSDSTSSTTRPVIHPYEVGDLPLDEALIFAEGVNGVIKAKRRNYLKEFAGKYRANPYFQKKGWW
jgi:type IV secretion system protein VirD4